MRRPTFRVLFLAVLAACPICNAGGVAATEDASARAPTVPFSRGLLWKIEYPGARASYLFGTLHSDDERVVAMPGPVRRAFVGSRSFALEMLNDEASTRKFRAAMVTREPLLRGQLGDELYPRVEELLGEHGIPRDVRARMRPWSALLVLLQPREAPGIIQDNLLKLEAAERGMRIHQLETVEEQIAAFQELPEATGVVLLRHAQSRYWLIQDSIRPVVHAYLERDLGAMWRINADVMEGGPAVERENAQFLEAVLYSRNRRFAERLVPLLREGGVFAAVGALHLYGARGVPSLLQKGGFRVTRVY